MSDPEAILRVAAKGDGITASGRHVAFAAPGDTVGADGLVKPGAHHATPACRHFGTCGGCELQHLDEETLAQFVFDRVVNVAAGQGLEPQRVAPAYLSPPRTRRRATLHAERGAIGFRARGSHRIVDMRECHVLDPALFALVAPLRALLKRWPGKRLAADVHLVLVDQGVAIDLKGLTLDGLAQTEGLLDFARDHALARLTLDQGYGPEAMWEPEPVTVALSGVAVGLPPGGFLQATADAEAALSGAVREWLGASATVADLFAGLGMFAFALAGTTKVLAVEAAQDAHFACKGAAGRSGKLVHAVHRDLYRNPLRTEELDRFAAVVLDPPRAGARDQVAQLAASQVARIAYISCNPSSWAKDAAALVAGGYRLAELRPIGQFRWSTHVELASLFIRQ
ncbi:class I SAM-dependent RNA methyltransferase [Novosphingobium sp. Gsoil 351]|uniref:class I SAM-dependent RNA methyltransferase n=1 Tax=Novosphingobium sp. Gsoil 351 TaxID=2675225 RepID=UPI0012B493A1|nr:class I SAM-dependent RNA methyltransferase [Novosphingobium sp. Gsoil 351]QGN53773.1 class I SAM-dependent RNA methyltransferase [Novosphingobium sp. Gsoil 351]